mmetsp:Transcript_15725/g.15861  ORF Transcript_15725/g.15861 Transcript_15725/m.15861 type:complete len:250 (+) Transcript_15725:129-878(+)|eukprot:CAMPEP_0182431608 /NCGR_PEP_ID=MMETSP1167-20130531/50492_1 /TAXON_ID=2988 /ORGANISM="Mallomonas Sp, Strain CCMP3275" /LENGTH=249 /DNA_ID=CAMNT_0024618135 /DNA_START=1 /DNA_END=750 /DNA_ORIENTATION=-
MDAEPQNSFGMCSELIMANESYRKKGKWTRIEEEYAVHIISGFESGEITLAEEELKITLRCYIAKKLQCDPMRISKKFAGVKGLGLRFKARSRVLDHQKQLYNARLKVCEKNLSSLLNEAKKSNSVEAAKRKFDNCFCSPHSNLDVSSTDTESCTCDTLVSESKKNIMIKRIRTTDIIGNISVSNSELDWKDHFDFDGLCSLLKGCDEVNNENEDNLMFLSSGNILNDSFSSFDAEDKEWIKGFVEAWA